MDGSRLSERLSLVLEQKKQIMEQMRRQREQIEIQTSAFPLPISLTCYIFGSLFAVVACTWSID